MTWRCIESDPPKTMQLVWLAGPGNRRYTPTEWHWSAWKTQCMIKGYTHWSPCEPPEDPPPNRPLETYANCIDQQPVRFFSTREGAVDDMRLEFQKHAGRKYTRVGVYMREVL